MNQSDSRRILWEHGSVSSFYLRDDQLPVYEFLHKQKEPFLEASRRYGKTTIILCYVLEKLRANPNWICRWVLPEKDQARTIVMPEIEKIQADCPDDLQFEFRRTDSVYVGPNGSQLFLYGVDKDKGKKLRGPLAHIVVADEFGFWNHPRVLRSVLRPQLLTTRGQLIIASTPSEDIGHPYYSYREKARRKDRFIQRTIYDNKSLTLDEIQAEMEEQGGADSHTWKREYLCQDVGDPTLRIVPEWNDERNIIPDDTARPSHFDAYVGGDSGVDDNTFIVFGYYDFLNDEVVIEDEFVTSGKPTKEIIDQAKIIEERIWGEKKPFRRVYDADKQVLVDVTSTHGYSVYLPEKAEKVQAINRFRVRVGAGKFKVKKKCVNLIRQLKVGQWRDEKHTDFARSEELKHLDGIAAAVYFNRSVITSRNPYPQYEGVSLGSHFVPEHALKERSEDEALADLFSSPLGGMFGGRT